MQWGVLIFAILVLLTVYLISYLETREKKKLEKSQAEALQKQQALKARLRGEEVETKQSDSQEFNTREIRRLSQDLVEKGGLLTRRFFGKSNKNKASESPSTTHHPNSSNQNADLDAIKPLIFVLYLRRQEGFLRGRDIVPALEKAGFTFGEHGIFHYKRDNKILFSAASMVKPGNIPMGNLGEFTTPGISIFMELPTHRSGRNAFVLYLLAVHTLQKLWNCQILDSKQQLITNEDLEKMRQQADRYPSESEIATLKNNKIKK
jgi:cell division protein ZipA